MCVYTTQVILYKHIASLATHFMLCSGFRKQMASPCGLNIIYVGRSLKTASIHLERPEKLKKLYCFLILLNELHIYVMRFLASSGGLVESVEIRHTTLFYGSEVIEGCEWFLLE